MKAIVNIKKGSFKEVNGLTFEVVEINESFISLKGANLEYPKNQVDFRHDEVIIVDLANEYKDVLSRYNTYKALRLEGDWTLEKYHKMYLGLLEYIKVNNIKNYDF